MPRRRFVQGLAAGGVLLGLSLLRRIGSLRPPVYPIAIAHFAGCMTLIVPTYGLWQNWFQAAIVISILVLVLIGRSRSAEPQNEPG